MLRKLMKQEFRATARLMLPLYGAVILLGLGAKLADVVMDASFGSTNGGVFAFGPELSGSSLLNVCLVLLCVGFVVALIASLVMAVVLMVLRFRNNLLGDEGYVMFTLPVSVHQLVWSKLLVSLVWFVGAVLVDGLAVLLVLAGDEFSLSALFHTLISELQSFSGYEVGQLTLILVEALACCILYIFILCLEFYAPMAIGHSFARRKGLLSVAFFFAIQAAGSLATSAIMMMATGNSELAIHLSSRSDFAAVQGVLLAGLVLNLLYGAVLYWLTTYMLKNRLNLE